MPKFKKSRTSTNPRQPWTHKETIFLIDDVERHRGPKGIYRENIQQAIRDVTAALKLKFPHIAKSEDQVKTKLCHANERWTKSKGHDLFKLGWMALKNEYQRENLAANENATHITPKPGGAGTKTRYSLKNGRRKRGLPSSARSNNIEMSDVSTPSSIDTAAFGTPRSGRKSPGPRKDQEAMRQPKTTRLNNSGCPSTAIDNQRQLDEGAERSLKQSLSIYLDNPRRYLPSTDELSYLKDTIVELIQSAVQDLLRDTRTKPRRLPVMDGSLSPSPFSDLCRVVFKPAEEQRLEEFFCQFATESQLDLDHFLRVFLAAAVMSWIFDGHHHLLPTGLTEKSEISVGYEKEIESVFPELHKQALRKINHTYVNEKINRQPFVSSLVHRCFDGLKTFLGNNLAQVDKHGMSRWYENLQKVFDAGLQLDLQVALLRHELRFEWPGFGAPFDRTSMTVLGEEAFRGAGRISAALFPCLMNRARGDDDDKVVLRGFVKLQ